MRTDTSNTSHTDRRARAVALFDQVINAHDEQAIGRFTQSAHISDALRQLLRGFPDLHVDIQWMTAEDDRVVAFVEMTGTHEGPWLMVRDATHRPMRANLLLALQFDDDGMVVDNWLGTNFIAMLAQLGWGVAPFGRPVPQPARRQQ